MNRLSKILSVKLLIFNLIDKYKPLLQREVQFEIQKLFITIMLPPLL